MPPKRRGYGRSAKMVYMPVQHGAGFFDDVWNGIKRGANWIKDNKIISRALTPIPGVAGNIGRAAGMLGLGKGRRRGRTARPSGPGGVVRF